MPTIEISTDVFAWLTAKAATEQARTTAGGQPTSFTASDLADAILTAAIPRAEYQLIQAEQAALNDDDIPF